MASILPRWLRALFTARATTEAPLSPAIPLPEITADPEEEGWHDFIFAATDAVEHENGELLVSAFGTHHGREVGLRIVIGREWEAVPVGKISPGTFFQQGTLRIESLGARSDSLLAAIDAEYETGIQPRRFRAAIPFGAMALEGHPRQLRAERVSLKLFCEPRSDDGYAELFVNIDLPKGRLDVREKDESYRAAIVRALQQD